MMKKFLALLVTATLITPAIAAQTPPPAPPAEKKADPKKPEKAEQEPRPVSQELQKQESQRKDAPPSNDTAEIFSASEMAKAGLIVAPRIFSTGTILYGAKSPSKAEINSLDDALTHLRRMKAVGAFSVKSYNQPRRDQRQQVIEAARQTRMMVVPEGGSLFEHNISMVVDGHTGIEHSIPVARIYDDVLQLWGKTRTGYTPTLVVGYGGSFGENYWYQKTDVYDDPRLTKFVPRRILDAVARRRTMIPDDEFNHLNNARIAKELRDVGVSVQLGAHGQREGLAAHWELSMLSQGGMKPLEVLRAGTIDGARYLGMDKDIGSLEPGKLADLIVLDRNPLENIQNTRSVRYTIVNGRMFDAETMNELGNHPRPQRKRSAIQMTDLGVLWLLAAARHATALLDHQYVVVTSHSPRTTA